MRTGGLTALIAAVITLAPSAARCQGPSEAFDLTSLQLPPGFLNLGDIQFVMEDNGAITATATTTLLNQDAGVLVSIIPQAQGGRGKVLAIRPREWSLTQAFPALANPVLDQLTLDHVTLVLTDQDLRVTAAEMPDEAYAFYREVYGTDDFTLVLKPGINLIAAVPVDKLEPGHPLLVVMDALGIERGTVLLQGALGRSLALLQGGVSAAALKDLFLRAELPPMRPPGSPAWFRSGQLALELTGEPSVRLVGEMNVLIEEDELQFFLATTLARSGISLAGGLLASDSAGWVAPLGVEWLTLKRVILKIGITPVGSVTLGFAGAAIIGEKDIDVAVALAVSPAGVPTNFMMEGESEAGVGIGDLARVQQGMAAAREDPGEGGPVLLPIEALPDIQIRSLGLRFAPKPDPDLGIERGFAIKGRLWLPSGSGSEMRDFAGVDVNVSDEGLWVRGDIGSFKLGPLTWDDAKLDLTATRETQHLIIAGQVDFLGARQMIDVSVARDALSFRSETELFGLFHAALAVRASYSLTNASFQVDAVMQNDFGQYLQPIVRDGALAFARAGHSVVDGAQLALEGTRTLVANTEATVQQLYNGLVANRNRAESLWQTAQDAATRAFASANAARAEMNAAQRLWAATPAVQVALRASRRADQLRWAAVYATRSAAYAGLNAAAKAQRAILDALPPPDQNVLLLSAQAGLAALRDQLRQAEQNLTALSTRLSQVVAAAESGVNLFTVEHAEFHGALDGLMTGSSLSWKIRGEFVGQPFELSRTLNFGNPAAAAADLLSGLIQG